MDDVATMLDANVKGLIACTRAFSPGMVARAEARGVLRARTRPTFNLLLLIRAGTVGVSIHHEGKSCGHVRSRFECLFSMTLLRGPHREHRLHRRNRALRWGGAS